MTTYRKCLRCGLPMTAHDRRYCPLCDREVRLLLEADARRNVVRFPRAADFTGRIAA
jgi:uncharacterized Zn finger protein (UPF0148 family)